MAVFKAIVSLYRAGEEKSIERYKTKFTVAEENKLFSSFQKKILLSLSGLNETRANGMQGHTNMFIKALWFI